MRPKESGKVRYAYGVAMALLLGGTAFSLATGQAGAQVAQNAPARIRDQRRVGGIVGGRGNGVRCGHV